MGVTGIGSTRWRRYNWYGWVLMVVVGVTKCVDDEDADAGWKLMIFLVGCCVMLSGEFPQTTTGHVLRNYSNDWIFELGEREILPAVEIVAIVDCSLSPPLLPMNYPIFGGLLLAVTPFHWALPPHQQVSPAPSMGDRNFVDCWVLHPSYHHQYPCWWWCDGKITQPVW